LNANRESEAQKSRPTKTKLKANSAYSVPPRAQNFQTKKQELQKKLTLQQIYINEVCSAPLGYLSCNNWRARAQKCLFCFESEKQLGRTKVKLRASFVSPLAGFLQGRTANTHTYSRGALRNQSRFFTQSVVQSAKLVVAESARWSRDSLGPFGCVELTFQ
jgi:hypothetical protein